MVVLLVAPAGPAVASDDAATDTPFAETFDQQVPPFFRAHCESCHTGDEPEADLDLLSLASRRQFAADRDEWERVEHMLTERSMPPDAEIRPTPQEYESAITLISTALSAFDCDQERDPGRVAIHRLNRVEYNNTIRDLVGVDFRPADDFPTDEVGDGFDNMADVLSLSPVLFEKYLDAAEQIIERVMEKPDLRERIVFCRPDATRDRHDCARAIITRFATRAFRRPVETGEVDAIVKLVDAAEQTGLKFDEQIATACQAILISPHFLFRIEHDRFEEHASMRALNSYEIASRLSYFLWSSMPDATLFELARNDALQDDAVIADQVRRMIQDDKASALMENFPGQWLQLRRLDSVAPDRTTLPHFDDALREAARTETQLFFQSILREDRSVLEFIDSDYSFVNARLAALYGISGVEGDAFQRVSLPRERGGVLTQASILTITSNPTRTSPVKRGKWILQNLLDSPPGPPPPDAGELDDSEGVELLGSLRERMEQHRTNPVCRSCHQRMDPLGFALENFDAVGQWRDRDGRHEIDASGALPDGTHFDGPAELRALLASKRRDSFCRCLIRKMLAYAIGRPVASSDRCAVETIMKRLAESKFRSSELIVAIAQSDPFKYRSRESDAP